MARTFEQHLTDLVEIDDLPGGVSLLTFAWETRDEDRTRDVPDMVYARTSDVERVIAEAQAAGQKVVDALADHKRVTRWLVLRRGAGVADILNEVPWEVVETQSWRAKGGLPSVFAFASEIGRNVKPADLYTFKDPGSGTLYSFLTDAPVTRAVVTDLASAEYYDLDRLAPMLEVHPWVKGVYFYAGRPSECDHVPAELHVVVRLPQNEYEQHLAAGGYTSGHSIGEALFWAPRHHSVASGLGNDPLGISSALRQGEYPRPQEEWDRGPTYPDLEESLPDRSDLWH